MYIINLLVIFLSFSSISCDDGGELGKIIRQLIFLAILVYFVDASLKPCKCCKNLKKNVESMLEDENAQN